MFHTRFCGMIQARGQRGIQNVISFLNTSLLSHSITNWHKKSSMLV